MSVAHNLFFNLVLLLSDKRCTKKNYQQTNKIANLLHLTMDKTLHYNKEENKVFEYI